MTKQVELALLYAKEGSDQLERDKRAVIRVPLYRWGGAQYFCHMTIGQTMFRMLLDTGSPSIWVPSDRVDRSLWVGKNLLSQDPTTSLQISRELFYEKYGSGEICGLKATVDINLGGILIREVPFGLVMDATREVYEEPVDGYIGLGRPTICPDNTNPLHLVVREKGLMSGEFGFEFQDSGATFMMGDNLEQVLSPARITYVDVVEGPYWEARISRILVSIMRFTTEEHRMIFDTGTHTIVLPEDIHMAINQVLGISMLVDGSYVFRCEMLPSMPPITFQIQGKTFEIASTQYTKQTTVNGDAMCATRFINKTADLPVGIILGMSFLHSFQMIFDDQAGRVGFAPRQGRSSIV
ncbi:Lysosomal aspartic protease [Clonorchis sinensis]|uniref:Lysosomal aspartic protease n=1 Tax=Clonorchis sinensis TaxID=79923 RepID=A0A3R7CDR8_CLOSI|nr:Lysosomal aspartic protease [Clonorchis sinensis]